MQPQLWIKGTSGNFERGKQTHKQTKNKTNTPTKQRNKQKQKNKKLFTYENRIKINTVKQDSNYVNFPRHYFLYKKVVDFHFMYVYRSTKSIYSFQIVPISTFK